MYEGQHELVCLVVLIKSLAQTIIALNVQATKYKNIHTCYSICDGGKLYVT